MSALRKRNQALLACVLLSTSCVRRLPVSSFRVLPAAPNYVLRSPDSSETPFPQVLRLYNGFEPGGGWMDLRPGMELRIENAYYQPGMRKRGLNGFLGTEIARYKVASQGNLRLLSTQSMKDRPNDQPPVQQLIGNAQAHFRHHRFYYAILFKRNGNARGSVLLGAQDENQIDRLATQLLADPDSVCNDRSRNCTVFPEACSVSIEMEIFVNGTSRDVIWNSMLANIAPHPKNIELLRLYNGRLTPVQLDPYDPKALRLPLLPGDHVSWN